MSDGDRGMMSHYVVQRMTVGRWQAMLHLREAGAGVSEGGALEKFEKVRREETEKGRRVRLVELTERVLADSGAGAEADAGDSNISSQVGGGGRTFTVTFQVDVPPGVTDLQVTEEFGEMLVRGNVLTGWWIGPPDVSEAGNSNASSTGGIPASASGDISPEVTRQARRADFDGLLDMMKRGLPGFGDWEGVLLRRTGSRVVLICQVCGDLSSQDSFPDGDWTWKCQEAMRHVTAAEERGEAGHVVALYARYGAVYGRKES